MSAQSSIDTAIKDIKNSFDDIEIALVFGWQDIAQRYRRSKVGALWLTVNMGVMIGALGIIFGTLFRMNMFEFLPFIATGLIFWGFISSVIIEGCTGFSGAEGIILQVRMPLFTHILRLWWRNTIILAHNLAIYPLVMLIFLKNPGLAIILVIPGFILISVNVLWMALALATICARYRDMPQVVTNIMQVLFYATPLMWTPSTLPEGALQQVLDFNPFYHLISIVRSPLLGQVPAMESWVACVVIAVIGWVFALAFFGRYRWRIPYWL